MTCWRQLVEPERLEVLLAESLAAAQRGGAVEERHLRRVTIDTTVQPKAVTILLHRLHRELIGAKLLNGKTAADEASGGTDLQGPAVHGRGDPLGGLLVSHVPDQLP
jgi:hypothetical protein